MDRLRYKLIRSARKSIGMEIKNGELIVRAPQNATLEHINSFIGANKAWVEKHMRESMQRMAQDAKEPRLSYAEIEELADEAVKYIPERTRYYAEKIGVSYGRITIRNQRTKWGSCSGKGNLNFNCLLMLAPKEVIDSVIVHELCHRKEMNHSERFYAEVLRVFPDYYKWDNWLKENGHRLMARMGA